MHTYKDVYYAYIYICIHVHNIYNISNVLEGMLYIKSM